MFADSRVIQLEYDSIQKKVVSVVLGDFQKNYLQDTTNMINRVESAIRGDGSVKASLVSGLLDGVKTQMRAQSSIAKKQNVRAMLFEDLDPDSPTFGAMALGTMGFQIAGERTADGKGWNWTTFGTGQGFFADFITAGTMLADRIHGGTLILGGQGNGNGLAKVVDENENEIIRMDNNGVYAKGSYVCAGTGGWDKRIELKDGTVKFSKLDGTQPIFIDSGAGAVVFRSGGEIGDATEGKTLIRIFSDKVCLDATVYAKGTASKSGRVEFSDGTYMTFANGMLTGGSSKEGVF